MNSKLPLLLSTSTIPMQLRWRFVLRSPMAELFISYNMPAKALGPLMAALPQAPNDLRLNQRLAALHTRAARFAEGGVCCRTLQNIYSEAGYPEEATRYGETALAATKTARPPPRPPNPLLSRPQQFRKSQSRLQRQFLGRQLRPRPGKKWMWEKNSEFSVVSDSAQEQELAQVDPAASLDEAPADFRRDRFVLRVGRHG